MSSSFEKSVKGATKIKLAPPKSKYIEHILIATHSGEHGVAEVFRALQNRLRDSTWTVVFKALITVHLMIREGSPNVTLEFLSTHKNMLATSSFTDVQTQGRNVRHYAAYLSERARGYRHCKCDFVRDADHHFERLTVEKGLLRETEAVQQQIQALLKCDVLDQEPENEITITVFRMLVLDLLSLFNVVNQAMISILGHFFEMSKSDAQRAMDIYRQFTKQTDLVVSFLSTARTYEHQTRVEVPKLKHAPVHLGKQLSDYLADPDFETNRRQYLAEQEAKRFAKKGGPAKPFPSPPVRGDSPKTGGAYFASVPNASTATPSTKPDFSAAKSAEAPKAKGPAPDLIDFFDSIEQNQQPLANAPQEYQQQMNAPNYAQQTGFQQQQAPPQQFQQNGFVQQPQQTGYADPNMMQQQQQFGAGGGFMPPPQQQQHQAPAPQLQTNFTGAGFGGYTPAPQAGYQNTLPPIPQQQTAAFAPAPQQSPYQTGGGGGGAGAGAGGLQPQTTNPFRASMMMQSGQNMLGSPSPIQPQTTNPFARGGSAPLPPVPNLPGQYAASPFQAAQQQQQQTHAQTFPVQPMQSPAPLQSQQTGTNPFAKGGAAGISRPGTAGGGLGTAGAGAGGGGGGGGLVGQMTGSTNPFRQSQWVDTKSGTPWQLQNKMPIGGGLDGLETVEVFPRVGGQQAWGQ